MRVRLVGLIALMGLVLASCGGAPPEAGGPSEGIQVHGDWTIDIYNEDGSLDEHVEFSNALTSDGAGTLAEALTGEAELSSGSGGSFIVLGGVSTTSPLDPAPCTTEYPTITETFQELPLNEFEPIDSEAFVSGACYVEPETIAESNTARASGSVIAEQSGTVDFVEFVRFTSRASGLGGFYAITRKVSTSPLPISVEAGQQVQIQVDISFTSG